VGCDETHCTLAVEDFSNLWAEYQRLKRSEQNSSEYILSLEEQVEESSGINKKLLSMNEELLLNQNEGYDFGSVVLVGALGVTAGIIISLSAFLLYQNR